MGMLTTVLRRLRQEDGKFDDSLAYTVRPCLKTTTYVHLVRLANWHKRLYSDGKPCGSDGSLPWKSAHLVIGLSFPSQRHFLGELPESFCALTRVVFSICTTSMQGHIAIYHIDKYSNACMHFFKCHGMHLSPQYWGNWGMQIKAWVA